MRNEVVAEREERGKGHMRDSTKIGFDEGIEHEDFSNLLKSGRPSHSPIRRRLNMMADRNTGGCIPVSAEYSQTMTSVTTR